MRIRIEMISLNKESAMHYLFCFIVLFLLAAPYIHSQNTKPLIGLIPIGSPDESEYLESLNFSLTDTLELTVRFIGDYRVRKIENFAGEMTKGDLKDFATKEGYDTIVFGSTSILEDGKVEIRLSSYNTKRNEISAKESDIAESLLETFSTTDKMVASLVEGFTDTRVEYGSILFTYIGAEADLDVFLDDTHIGTNINRVSRMVAGTHRLRVERSVDKGPVYLDRTVEIAANAENEFVINVPFLSLDERSELKEIDRRVSLAWGDPTRREEIHESITRALTLLEKSTSVGADRMYDLYRFRKTAATEIESIDTETRNNLSVPDELYRFVLSDQGVDKEERAAEAHTPFSQEFEGRQIVEFLPFRTIEVDGEVDDWEGIEAYATDIGGDSSSSIVGSDLRKLYIAMDRKYTYIRIDTEKGAPGSSTNFWYVLSFWKPFMPNIEYSLQVHNREGYVAEVTKYNRTNDSHPSKISYGNRVRMKDSHIEARYLNSTILRYLEEGREKSLSDNRYEYFKPAYFLVGYDSEVRDRVPKPSPKEHIIYREWD